MQLSQRIKHIINLFRNKRVLIDEKNFYWLSLSPDSLKNELLRYKYNTIFYNLNPSIPVVQTHPKVESMSDAINYLVCNKLECQRNEIDLHDYLLIETSSATEYANLSLLCAHNVIDQIRPSIILFVQGYTIESAALRSACIEKSIPFIAFENTGRYDRLLWDDCSGITVNCNLAKNYYWRFRNNISTDEVTSYHQDYIKNQKLFKSAEHTSPSCIYDSPDNRPLLTWIGQVYTDSSVLFGLNSGFTTPIDCIKALLSFALDHDCRVFLKMHPKEHKGGNFVGKPYNQLTARKLRESAVIADLIKKLGDNFLLDDVNKFDTFSLIEKSSLVATVNSQAGLESAIRGVPVLLCGNAFYGGLGFVKEAYTEQEVYSKIEECLISKPHNRHTENARIFNYIFFEKYCIPKSVMSIASLVTSIPFHRQHL
jgi:hypothetical protein